MRFASAITWSILAAGPMGFVGVYTYLLWMHGPEYEYLAKYAGIGAIFSFGVAGLAMLVLGAPLYVFLERRRKLNPWLFTQFGVFVALVAYVTLFWGTGGREPMQIGIQALITGLIGGGVAGVLMVLAPPNKLSQ